MAAIDPARGIAAQRETIADRLAALVAGWAKYAALYAADAREFARIEFESVTHYVAEWLRTGERQFVDLYIGEKAKQFHDPATDPAERAVREAALLAAERAIFAEAIGGADAEPFFDAVDGALRGQAAARARLLFVGDCLFLDVVAFLTGPARADGIAIDASFATGHDEVQLRAEIGRLVDERFDAVFFSPFTYAALAGYGDLQRPRAVLDPRAVAARVGEAGDAAERVLDTLADLFDCPIFVHAPAAIMRHEDGARERLARLVTAPARHRAARVLSRRMHAAAERHASAGVRVRIVDEAALVAPVGLGAAGRYLHRSALQHPARFGALVAAQYRDVVFAVARLTKRKLVACDLDNTLWEGVIGEGLGVRHHADRQTMLAGLKARGVVLAINSKNDPARVSWEGATLAAADFVSSQINWDPKPLNIQRIADHLNLKPKDFVFVDDRADERAMVAEGFPGLLALDALDPRTWRLMALWRDLLPEKPDADRTDFYRQRDARVAFLSAEEEDGAGQRAALYAGLGLTLSVREAQPADLARVTELINRTNQFNMTASPISARQVEAHAASPDARILVAEGADRFGPMGIISVLIAAREDGALNIAAFVLSCRVFGYGMETAILDAARRLAAPGEALTGRLVETEWNGPCRALYPASGFVEEGGLWRLADAAHRPLDVPAWLKIDEAVAPFSPRVTAH